MSNKDKRLLEEAYLSATGKIPSTPADKEVVDDEDEVEDTDTDVNSEIETAGEEEPMVISIGGPVDDEAGDVPPHTFNDDEDETWQDHENEEIRMVKTNLFTLAEDAKLLHDALHEGEELEPWMQQKIAVASEMLCGVAKVVRYYIAKKSAGV
jgi:hypothetical protein